MNDVLGFLDMRTIIFTMVMTTFVCTLVMVQLWKQNHKRLDGITYWVLDFSFQTIAVLLIVARGSIPDWISIDLANTLSMVGIYLGLFGLERFFQLKGRLWPNLILLVLFQILFVWYTFGHPDLAIRNLLIGIFSLFFCFQCFWLLSFKVKRSWRKHTLLAGIAFFLYCILDISRILDYFLNHHYIINYFESGSYETFVMLSYMMLLIVLTFGLALMFNRRLLDDIALEEEKFSKAFHTSPNAIILTRMEDGRILEVNESFFRFTGYSTQDTVGTTSLMMGLWENPDDRAKVLEELRLHRLVRNKELNFRRKDGSRMVGLFSAEVLPINGEQCLFSSINDISKRKKAEEELKESEEQLRNLNATKDKFFSIIAHDLRSPFSSVLGFSKLLSESIQSQEYNKVEEYAGIIEKSTQRTMDLLTNLLEWSRSQTGRMDFSPEYVELKALLNEVLDLFDQPIRLKSIDIHQEDFPSTTVFVDRILLSTILRNLLSNAIKFTYPGGDIYLSAKRKNTHVEICVRDSGIGISPDDLVKLFKIEENSSRNGTLNEQGTGLGLLLCKEFVEKHHGKIWVESEAGKGSAFYFTLPSKPL